MVMVGPGALVDDSRNHKQVVEVTDADPLLEMCKRKRTPSVNMADDNTDISTYPKRSKAASSNARHTNFAIAVC